jgi:hypothetical protein
MANLYLVRASEQDGERTRPIEFLVRADDQRQARLLAEKELKEEWGVEPDWDSTDGDLRFFNGEIRIDDITVNPISEKGALEHFTRPTCVDDVG